MKKHRQDIAGNFTARAAALVESHSLLATLLAVLCLAFAINFFLTGPGSDGGSGFGGTGKFPGESGFGGTGKTPNDGSGLKLGANDSSDQELPLSPLDSLRNELNLDAASTRTRIASLAITPRPQFDVSVLRFSPEAPLAPAPGLDIAEQALIDELVAGVILDGQDGQVETILQDERHEIAADTLVASLDILNSLILAESQAALEITETLLADTSATDAMIRTRIAVPVRPERPDRFTVPTRISPVQRVDIPAPPPVRPMRTLSTLLNH